MNARCVTCQEPVDLDDGEYLESTKAAREHGMVRAVIKRRCSACGAVGHYCPLCEEDDDCARGYFRAESTGRATACPNCNFEAIGH